MKKRFLLFIVFIMALLLSGCSLGDLPFLTKIDINASTYSENDFEFLVEKVLLSKGYQNTNPKVELVTKLDETRILITPGLVKSSGMEVSDITLVDNVVNISIINSSYSSAKLVIPQISILLTKLDSKELDKLEFNIINENYEPVEINYGIVDVLNKVQADFKISTDSYPDISLVEKDDSILWEINFENIFDIQNIENPIIDLELLVDSETGQVIMSKKSLISSLVDEGEVLASDQNYGFLYSKNIIDNLSLTTEIWLYDFLDSTKTKIYTTQSDIISAKFRPDGLAIAFIEKNGNYSSPYILELSDKRVTKIVLEENQMPEQIDWKSTSELSILTSFQNNQSNIFLYDTKENTIRTALTAVFDISNFSQFEDTILLSEYIDNTKNNKIKLWDQENGFVFIANGYSPTIINKNYGAYIEKAEYSDSESLHIFSLKTLKDEFTILNTISSFNVISPDELYITESSAGNSCYHNSILNLDTKELQTIGNINSAKSFYHKNSELVYLNLSIPYEENSPKIIFSIPTNDLKRR
ncbi:MAG: hypothetical protein RBR71_08605 [Gudongella sp.]|nr:hypothetical protein [Gudongella sp.]